MNQKVSAMIGTVLILLGGLFMLINVAYQATGTWVWQTWPLFVIAAGTLFMLAPFFFRQEKWTGVFFIPGMIVLVTGLLLLVSSLGNVWKIWGWCWVLEVFAISAGLILAALTTRILWMIVPAVFLAATGLILAYCAVTGDWGAWVWLWGFEVAGVGFTILTVGYLAKDLVVRTVGWSFVGFGAFASTMMMALAGRDSRPMSYLSAVILILGGIALVAAGFLAGKKKLVESDSAAANS
jgi:hypothetical protein